MPGSRPEVGSSRKSSEGLVSSSRATQTRLRWPPERAVMPVSARLSRPSSCSTSSIRPSRSAALGVAGEAQLGRVLEGAARRSAPCAGCRPAAPGRSAGAARRSRGRGRGRRSRTCPRSAGRMPVSARSRVDLPEPLGPTTPAGTSRRRGSVTSSSRTLPPRRSPTRSSDVEGDVAGVDELLQLVARPGRRWSGRCRPGRAGRRAAGDRLAVDEGAVVAAEVDDLVAAVRAARAARRGGARPGGRRRPGRCPARGRCAWPWPAAPSAPWACGPRSAAGPAGRWLADPDTAEGWAAGPAARAAGTADRAPRRRAAGRARASRDVPGAGRRRAT